MPANTSPIFTAAPVIQWGATDGNGGAEGPLKTANTTKSGTGTVLTVFTADATNGGYVQNIRFRAAGTNAATVARIFINNGSDSTVASNNILIDEVALSFSTISESTINSSFECVLNKPLPAGYKINVTIGTTVAAGYYVSVFGGKY